MYCLTYKNEPGRGGYFCFDKPVTAEDIANFREWISDPEVDIKNSFLTRWNEETQKVEAIIGTIANPFKCFEHEASEAYWDLTQEDKDLIDPIVKALLKD